MLGTDGRLDRKSAASVPDWTACAPTIEQGRRVGSAMGAEYVGIC